MRRGSAQRGHVGILLGALRPGALVLGLIMTFGAFVGGRVPNLSADEPDEPKKFLYDAKEHRDPFVPLVRDGRIVGVTRVARQAEPLKPVLYGILWDPGGTSIALVNDLEVREGDSVGAFRVQEIRANSVLLMRDGGAPVVLELAFGGNDG